MTVARIPAGSVAPKVGYASPSKVATLPHFDETILRARPEWGIHEDFTVQAYDGAMTPKELEAFLAKQASLSARIAQKTARAKKLALSYSQIPSPGTRSLGSKILNSLSRPGVAPSRRPKSAAGAETFHFAVTTVNKASDFVTKLKGTRAGAGAAHEAYIEREGAAEKLGSQFAKTKAEMHDEVWEALGGQAYIERPGAAEPLDGRSLASFGNIAPAFEDRLAFWEAMEEAASKPKSNGIATQRGNDAAFWAKVDADPNAPQILREAPPFIPLPADERASGANTTLNIPSQVPTPRYPDEKASEVLDYVRKHRSRTPEAKKAPAVVIEPGRGGRIQTRIIIELPHELTPAQRLKLAQDFAHKKFVQGREIPLPHWCVIHAPDHHNDPRNTHMHIVFAERPAVRMSHPETGDPCWDFEIIETTTDKHWNKRSRRPFEKPTDRSVNSNRWVAAARKDYATLANQALAAAGKPKIYDARTYKAMGIAADPRARINAKDYIKEKRGETTAAGTEAINSQWEREEQRLSARYNRFGAPKRHLEAFDLEIPRWRGKPSSVWAHLLVHRHEYGIATAFVSVIKAEKAANAFVLAKIQSKILPPLQDKDEEALLAQDFLRMYRKDIVQRHDENLKIHQANAKRALKALKEAQKADPKTTTDAGFLTGRPPLHTLHTVDLGSRPMRGVRTVEEPFKAWREAKIPEVAEGRELRAAYAEQVAARKGDLIPDATQQRVDMAQKPSTAPTAKATGAAQASPGPETQAPTSTPTPQAEAPRATSKLDLKLYAETMARLTANAPRAAPDVASIDKTGIPASMRKYGDEVKLAFFSESGAPIQHRVISATRVRTADEQAAAVEASIKRRREERQTKYEAEIAAMRAAPADSKRSTQGSASSVNSSPTRTNRPPMGDLSAIRTFFGVRPAAPVPSKAQTAPTAARSAAATAQPPQTTTRPPEPITQTADQRAKTAPVQTTIPSNEPAIAPGREMPKTPTPTAKPNTEPPITNRIQSNDAAQAVRTPNDERTTIPPATPTNAITTSPEKPEAVQADIPMDDGKAPFPDRKKKRAPTAEELRKRALMAARSRDRGR